MAKYSKDTKDKILDMLRTDTYTLSEICRAVGIGIATFYLWRDKYEDFAQAVEEAKEERMQFFVQEAKKSLLKKIQGYEVKETKLVTIPNKADPSKPIIKEQTTTTKHVQADTAAIIFTLTNGDPTRWRNRQTTEVTGKDGKELFKSTSDEELDKEIADLERKLGNKQ